AAGGGGAAAGGVSATGIGALVVVQAAMALADVQLTLWLWDVIEGGGGGGDVRVDGDGGGGKAKCKPCDPPVGTVAYRTDQVPPARPHAPFAGTHTHLYVMMQSPPKAGCKCFWHRTGVINGAVPPPGAVPIQPAGGGGIA